MARTGSYSPPSPRLARHPRPTCARVHGCRPVVVLVHGGSFEGGDKTSDGEPDLARALASRGYAAFSINYRLTGTWVPPPPLPRPFAVCCSLRKMPRGLNRL